MEKLVGKEVWMLTVSEPDLADLEGVYTSRDKAEEEVLKTYETLKGQPWGWQDFSEIDRTEDYSIYEGKWNTGPEDESFFSIHIFKTFIQ